MAAKTKVAGELPHDLRSNPIPVERGCQYQDASDPVQASPLTVNGEKELVIPNGATSLYLQAGTNAMKYGDLTGFTTGHCVLLANKETTIPVAGKASVFVDENVGASNVTLSFRFGFL